MKYNLGLTVKYNATISTLLFIPLFMLAQSISGSLSIALGRLQGTWQLELHLRHSVLCDGVSTLFQTII